MNATGMPAAERQPIVESEFLAWLDEDGAQGLVSHSHGRYYVHCVEFNLAGSGETEEAAVENASALVTLYLQASYLQGKTFDQAKKGVPAAIRMRLWLRHLRGGVLKRLVLPIGRLGRRDCVPISHDVTSYSA